MVENECVKGDQWERTRAASVSGCIDLLISALFVAAASSVSVAGIVLPYSYLCYASHCGLTVRFIVR